MAAEYAWDAARADIEAVLVSKHGGEPLALLEELDRERETIVELRQQVGALQGRSNRTLQEKTK